ncbi:sensor histidine kinase [Sulfitobacter sabulilitoris]|nr:HAMP domain-containing sensor histidine kinase [Sulfitobacter sabulilitoris]
MLIRKMRDYSRVGMRLFWQRQISFAASIILAGFYFELWISLTTAALIILSETYDYMLFTQIRRWVGRDARQAKRFLYRIYIGTVLSAAVISFFTLSIALEQGPSTHFMPLFFLFSAALFAAMNNHHLLSVLTLRLSIYGVTFLFIPIYDIVSTGAPMSSPLWVQFFTSLFVLYFIIDCSRVFMNMYQSNLRHIDTIKAEHEKTKAAYKVKSEFLSTVSHELRTPLTSIKGSLDLANSGALGDVPPKVKAVLTIAQRNSTRLTQLINEILDLQKAESGKMEFKFKPVEIGSMVEQAIEMNRPFADRCNVTIESEIPAGRVFVNGDQSRLEQVMTNLLSNAAKFSNDGGRVIVRVDAQETKVRIHVIDEGIGLSEASRVKVFDQFSQLDSTDQRIKGGTGLGMNISKSIIEAHGATIDYTKNKGAGTTFFVELDRISVPGKLAGGLANLAGFAGQPATEASEDDDADDDASVETRRAS